MEQNKKNEKSSKDKKVVIVISLIIVMILISVAVIFNKDKIFNNTEVEKVETLEKNNEDENEQKGENETEIIDETDDVIEYSDIIKINNNIEINSIECVSLWKDFDDSTKNKVTLNGKNKNESKIWSYEIEGIPHPDATVHTFNIIGINNNKLYIFICYDASFENELNSKIITIDINNGKVISTTKCPYVYNPKMAIDENGNKYIAGFGGQGAYELDFIILDSNDQYIKKVSTDNEIFLNKIDDANSSLGFLEMKEENGEKYLSGYVYETEKSNILISLNLLFQKDNITKEDAFIK